MAQSLDEILKELDASYNPQRQSLQTRIDALPGQADAEISGLKATQDQAFNDILGGARDRGMGFSGVPLAEQSRYTASTFLPAVARVRQSQNESRQSLFDALNNVNLQQNQYAQSLRESQLNRDEQVRQFNEQLAAQQRAAAAQNSVYSGLFGGGQQSAPTPAAVMSQRQDKGFNFADAGGRPISAAQFAATKGVPFRSLLQEMANAGDQGAKQALGFVGDDFGYDPAKLNSQNLAQLYNSLTWGTGLTANYQAPQPNAIQRAASQLKNVSAPTLSNASAISRYFR